MDWATRLWISLWRRTRKDVADLYALKEEEVAGLGMAENPRRICWRILKPARRIAG